MGEQQFFPTLIREIIEEEFSENAESERAETIRRLLHNNTVPESSLPEIEEKQDGKGPRILLEGLRLLSPAGPALISISEKIIYNSDIIANAKTGFFQRFFQLLSGKKKTPQRIYDIVIFNAENETGSKIKVDINRLADELVSTGKLLASYGNKSSRNYQELMRGSGEELLKELSGNIRKLFMFQSKLAAIDLYMKDRSTNAMRASMHGIKLDLNDVQSCMFKANNRKAEYQPV